MTYLPGHDGKVTSDKKTISILLEGSMGGGRDYYRDIVVTFETTGKFVIVFGRLILGKVGVDVFTGQRRESDVGYKIHFKSIL